MVTSAKIDLIFIDAYRILSDPVLLQLHSGDRVDETKFQCAR